MTLENIAEMLEGVFPNKVAYRCFKSGTVPEMPFVCYLVSYSNNFAADGIVYDKINHIQIELYTDKKDLVSEGKIETALLNAGLCWRYIETYIDTERCYQIIYEIEV